MSVVRERQLVLRDFLSVCSYMREESQRYYKHRQLDDMSKCPECCVLRTRENLHLLNQQAKAW